MDEAVSSAKRTVDNLNKNYAVVRTMNDTIIRLADGQLIKTVAFLRTEVRDQNWSEVTLSGRSVTIYGGDQWLASQNRRIVQKITFTPLPAGQQPPADYVMNGDYNVWRGWPFTLKEGDTRLYQALRKHLSNGQYDGAFDWLEKFFAYRLLNPAEKIPKIIILLGPEGAGKNSLLEMFASLFAPHYTLIQSNRFIQKFNKHEENKLIIAVDELSISDKRAAASIIKGMVSRKKMWIEPKGFDMYEVDDFITWLITSNSKQPLYLAPNDRRALIIRTSEGMTIEEAKAGGLKFGALVKEFCKDPKAIGALAYYLTKLDLSKFNPYADPPMTEAKEIAIEGGLRSVEAFCRNLVNTCDTFDYSKKEDVTIEGYAPFQYLPDLVTSQQILELMPAKLERQVDTYLIGTALGNLTNISQTKQVRTIDGPVRLWILRYTTGWLNAAPDAIRKYWEASRLAKLLGSKYDEQGEVHVHLDGQWRPVKDAGEAIDDYFMYPKNSAGKLLVSNARFSEAETRKLKKEDARRKRKGRMRERMKLVKK